MAILLLGEQLRLFHLIGYALVLAGVVIASRRASATGCDAPRAAPYRASAFARGRLACRANKAIKSRPRKRNGMIALSKRA